MGDYKKPLLSSFARAVIMAPALCSYCGRSFYNSYTLRRHTSTCKKREQPELQEREGGGASDLVHKCGLCKKQYKRYDNLLRHLATKHQNEELAFRCGLCESCFPTVEELDDHRKNEHVYHTDFQLVESAHRKQCQLLRANFPSQVKSLDQCLEYTYDHLCRLASSVSTKLSYYKLNACVFIEMYRLGMEGEVSQVEVFPFRGQSVPVYRDGEEVRKELRKAVGDMERAVDEFLFMGSGWIVSHPMYIDAEIVQCLPLHGRGGCSQHSVNYERGKGITPKIARGEDDGMCFFLAVAAHFCPKEATQVALRNFIKESMRGVEEEKIRGSGMPLKRIAKFEEDNPHLDLSINVVYKDENGDVLPARASKKHTAAHSVVLMLFCTVREVEEEGKREVMHYALVPEPEKLFAVRAGEEEGKQTTENVFICWNCHNVMRKKQAYEQHISFCHENLCQRIAMPGKGDTLHFSGSKKMDARSFKSAFMLFFDFEALQVPVDKACSCPPQVIRDTKEWEKLTEYEKGERVREQSMLEADIFMKWEVAKHQAITNGKEKMPKMPSIPKNIKLPRLCPHKTKVLHEQPPFAYSYILVDRDGEVRERRTYTGEDCADDFVLSVIDLSKKYLPSLTPGKPMTPLSEKEKKWAARATHCYICGKEMHGKDRVRDHDHLNGSFLGMAHNRCNLKRREQVRLTCFAHNFTGYDSHFIIKALNKHAGKVGQISAIPLNTQKFKSISLSKRIVFVDSCQFLPDSLANLVDTLKKSHSPFSILDQLVENEEEKTLLLRKGVYPYSFATSQQRLEETTCLPQREEFWNDLREEECSEVDYKHAERVWKKFRCRNMLDYTKLYVISDVFLLAEVVMDFRNMIWNSFNLDMCQYLSLPHLAKDIMLKESKAHIDLIDDFEMSDLLQKNIRGGLSFANVRHAEKTDAAACDGERRSLLYLDANNLYGESMKHALPYSDFRWMSDQEIEDFDPNTMIHGEEGAGYILEVDLEYPTDLHMKHNSFPLAPESIEVTWDMLSPYSKQCLEVLKGGVEEGADAEAAVAARQTHSFSSKKLSATFRNR